MTDPTLTTVNPAIFFASDAYVLPEQYIMGRHAAGAAFLRAAVKGRADGEELTAVTAFRREAEIFTKVVQQIDPSAKTAWIPASRINSIADNGLLYRPDLRLGDLARQRLRIGPAAYSLCGVTHTLSSKEALEAITHLVVEPIMAWDAVICTSRAALSVMETVLDEAQAQNRWRFGAAVTGPRPMLPVIPLGVHCEDFAFTDAERQTARKKLGLADDEVAFLSAGRLSINSKAHPLAMFRALQAVAEQSGVPIVLVFSGQAYNEAITKTFQDAVKTFCPSVRTLFVDGSKSDDYRAAWAGSDVFVSLADSIQETFGLTPLEAMAAGLPALVSDWDGYKDTVRDGIDGFRVTTWAPPADAGERIAKDFEIGLSDYNFYLYICATGICVDPDELLTKTRALVADPALRKRMGEAGRQRALSEFDWAVVYRRYRALWAEQAMRRRAALADDVTREWLARAPKRQAAQLGPFTTFADFPTRRVGMETRVTLNTDLDSAGYNRLISDPLLSNYAPPVAVFEAVTGAVRSGPTTIGNMVAVTGLASEILPELVVRLAKLDLVRLALPAPAGAT